MTTLKIKDEKFTALIKAFSATLFYSESRYMVKCPDGEILFFDSIKEAVAKILHFGGKSIDTV